MVGGVVLLWMGQRNPAPPKGWLKPFFNHGMFTIYKLVLRISLASTGWLSLFDASNLGEFGGLAGSSRDPPADKSQGVLPRLGPTSTKFYPV